MITDARALQPDFVPQELHRREGEIDALTSALSLIADGFSGENAFIFGSSGTAKTTIARYVVDLLQRETLASTTGYVNAMSNSTQADALYGFAQDAGLVHDIRKEGTHASRFLNRISDVEGHFVAIVGEVHVLQNYKTLQLLWEEPNVILLIVCLDEGVLEGFGGFDVAVVQLVECLAVVADANLVFEECAEFFRVATQVQRLIRRVVLVDLVFEFLSVGSRFVSLFI